MAAYVYQLVNKVTNKRYIGFTIREPDIRKAEHLSPSQYKRKTKLYSAIKSYGVNNFIFEVIYCSMDEDHCLAMEAHFIKEFNSISHGYNLTAGGDRALMTEQVKAKISATKLGHKVSKETRYKLSLANRNSWVVYTPDNQILYTDNLMQLCNKLKINYSSITKTAPHHKHRRTSSFGYRCEKLSA